jgi:hypothetical protein
MRDSSEIPRIYIERERDSFTRVNMCNISIMPFIALLV